MAGAGLRAVVRSAVVAEDLERVCVRSADALEALAGATVLVAGAAGFLPGYVADALAFANDHTLPHPCRIICLDNFATGRPERLAHLQGRDDVRLLDRNLVDDCDAGEPIDYIIHGASIASPTWYRQHPLETIDVNVIGTRRLLDLAQGNGVRGFVYLSSSEVYGDPPPERIPTTEDYWGNVSTLGPRACYDESKRLAETLCTVYHRQFGVPTVIVRPFNVYGPGLRLDDGRVLPDFLGNALRDEPITVYSDGRVTRSFCYVQDAVAGLLALLTGGTPGEAYNLGNDEEVTIQHLAQTLDEVTGRALGVRFASSDDPHYLTDNPQRRCPDLRKVTGAVDWRPAVPLRDGLERTYRHYTQAGLT